MTRLQVYILDQSIWEYNDHFDHWFLNSSIFMYTELAQGSFIYYISSSSTLHEYCTAP